MPSEKNQRLVSVGLEMFRIDTVNFWRGHALDVTPDFTWAALAKRVSDLRSRRPWDNRGERSCCSNIVSHLHCRKHHTQMADGKLKIRTA